MNFELAGTGHSFKGAMKYYLHDKREDGQEVLLTSDRVQFTEVRNMMEVGPHTATRIMIGTAARADELKQAAGVASTGRKATSGPVFAFSLEWHPDELPSRDRDEMLKAADHALKLLKLDDRQAVIVAHQDTDHPHVHIIVNRVHPETGKMATIAKPDVLKLDRWAYEYERDRGRIFSPNRAQKYQQQDRNRDHHPEDERKKYVADKKAEQERTRGQFTSAASGKIKSPATILKELSDAQKVDHKTQWVDLSSKNKEARGEVYTAFDAKIQEAINNHKAECKPIWRVYFKEERAAALQWEQWERAGIVGKVRNAFTAATIQKQMGQAGARSTLSLVFANTISGQARRAAFEARQEMSRHQLAARLRSILDAEIATLKNTRANGLSKQRETFDQARAALVQKQNDERAGAPWAFLH